MQTVLLLKSLLLTGSCALLLATPAWSKEVQLPKKPQRTTFSDQAANTTNQAHTLPKKILRHKIKNNQKLVQAPEVVQVTGVKLNSVDKQLEIILETTQGEKLQVLNKSEGNNFILDIPNAQLRLSTGEVFSQEKPFTGITAVTVTNLDTNTIRVTVTGEASAPAVELFDSDEGLILGVTPTQSTSQTPSIEQPASETPPTEQPTSETPSEQPTAETPETEEPIELVVTGEQDSYRVPEASAATRTDTPIRDIPQSIQVIPRQVLQDQQVIRVTDAIRNVSGVVEGDTFGGTVDNFNIRGFDFTSNFRDGLRDTSDSLRELANIEQIEVLKGPASVLYGNAEPGGIINLVTKKPLATPYYFGEFSIGNFSYYRSAIDLSGPLNPDETLLYRLNVAYENTGSFRDFVSGERFFFGPVFDLKLGDRTNLLFDFSYLDDDRTMDQGLVAIGRRVADVPISRFLGEPGDERTVEEINVGYRFEHRFNDNITLRNAFRYTSNKSFDYRAQPLGVDEETGELSRNFRSNRDILDRYAFLTDLVSKFQTGSIEHTVLVGLDIAKENRDGSQRRFPGGLTPSINIFNPVYNAIPRPAISELDITRDERSTTQTLGIYLQDQIAFSDNFKFLIGGRFDVVDQDLFNRRDNERTVQFDEAFTPRIGIVYQPIEPISLYASYSRSFTPNFAQRADLTFLPPERGNQYEIGVKADLNERLSATLAAYEITRTNIATPDPNDFDFSIPIGEQRSRGIELDVSGEILPGWNIIASYGYTDARVTQSNDLRVGARVPRVPKHKASLWTTYEFLEGDLEGLGFGLGLFYLSDRVGGDIPSNEFDDTYVLPSYLRTDAAIYYKRDNWRAAINFENLFGVRYFESFNFGRVTVIPGAPFTVVGTISVEF